MKYKFELEEKQVQTVLYALAVYESAHPDKPEVADTFNLIADSFMDQRRAEREAQDEEAINENGWVE